MRTATAFRRPLMLAWAISLICAAGSHAELRVTGTMVGARDDAPYAYGRLEVQNRYGREMTYRLVIREYFVNQRIVLQNQSLGAGQTGVYHVPLPHSARGGWQVEVTDARGRESRTSLQGASIHFLHVSSLQGRSTAVERERFAKAHGPPHGYSSSFFGGHSTPGDCVYQMLPTELPDNWLCYCPFLVVFVDDSSWQDLGATQRRALDQWVQSGGRLVIYGISEPERREPRMLGMVEYVATNPLQEPGEDGQWRLGKPHWQSLVARSSSSLNDVPYLIRKFGGGVGGLTLATLFFVVAGPLNYWYFARRNRIRALLISLPLASLACCLLITVYFLATQGFAKRGGSLAVIVLDEETDSALTFSRHVFFSGLYPLGGFRFPRDVAFCPMGIDMDNAAYAMDLTREQQLQSGLFAPSANFHYLTVRPWTTRAKLVWDLDDMTVLNGFDADAERVVLRVGDQVYEARDVGRGGKAPLVEMTPPAADPGSLVRTALDPDSPEQKFLLQRMSSILTAAALDRPPANPDEDRQPTPTYVIVFASPPVDLNAGLTIGGGNASCVLVGRSLLRGEPAR